MTRLKVSAALAALYTLAAIICDMAGTTLIHLGEDE